MDCDDVALLLARDASVLADADAIALDAHVADCETCFELVAERGSLPTARDRGDATAPLTLKPVDPERLELGETIASGGMGKITRAFDRSLGREVALKESLVPSSRARFEREAAITARLQHPAIIPIYDAGTWPNGTPFYTMRLVSGETLTNAIERRATLAQRLELLPHVIAVTEAIAYAHARGVIHRDLKPHNVLIGEFGETVVIDWGLAKALDEADVAVEGAPALPALTQAGSIVGTPCFLAPEQAQGEPLDARADVFAIGALLYNVLAGAPPYWDRSQDSDELVAAALAGPPTPIAALAPQAPADLCAIVEQAMARSRADRYPDASVVAAELRRFQAGQLLASRAYRIRDLVGRWIRRHRALVGVGGAALVVLAIVGGLAIRNAVRARAAEREAVTAFARGQRKLCAASAPQLASPWTADAKGLVHRKFESTKLAFVPETLQRVDASFERWSAQLVEARELVCAGDRPRVQLAVVLDCLGDRIREARALIGQFHDANKSVVVNAIGATEQLTPIAQCTSTPLPPPATTAAPEAAAIRDLFARAHVFHELGKGKDALPLAKKAVVDADALGDMRLRAAARVSLGVALLVTGSHEEATATLQTALLLAERAHDDRTRAQAWVNLVRIEYLRGRHEQATLLKSAALGATERVGDVFLQTEVMLFLGGAYTQLGKQDEARALFEQAVALRRQIYGDRDWRLANALSALGNAYAMKGDLERGIAAHRESTAIGEAALGPAHPNVGTMHGNLGSDYLYAMRTEEARKQFETSLAIAIGAHGDSHRDVGNVLTSLATTQLQAGEYEAALATYARAEAVWLKVNPKQPAMAEVFVGRHVANRALGKPTNIAELETALELAKALPPFMRARVQLALGKALTGARAVELVEASAAGFATSMLPLSQRELADANAWLAAHGAK